MLKDIPDTVIINDNKLYPYLGYGLGLRAEYYNTILDQQPDVDWLEIISENYMVDGGKPLSYLDKFRERYPLVMHGVSLSIGSTDPLNKEYLRQLKALVDRIDPVWVSDHLCWTIHGGLNAHDLLPLPYTQAAIEHVVDRIGQVQDFLGRRMLMENVSSYVTYTESEMSEWEFFSSVVDKADCLMLLDINNIHVSAVNHRFDPVDYINAVPAGRVQQIHLAGHTDYGDFIIDTHDHPVVDSVWDLYEYAIQRFGPVSTMIERDDNFPPFEELMTELDHARQIGRSKPESRPCTA
jgi:uncharacterized protein (UPF0276 family)